MVSRWIATAVAPLLLAASLTPSLTPSLAAQEYNFGVYRQSRGLQNLTVSDLSFDRQGFLWAGTENGLYRFLGDRFQRFGSDQGIQEREIQCVLAAPDGTLLVGTYRNLYRWTGSVFQPAASQPIAIWNSQHLAAEAPGRLLVVEESRLFRLSYNSGGKTLSYESVYSQSLVATVPALRHLSGLFVASDGAIWTGCGYGICSSKDGKLTEFTAAEGLPQDEKWLSLLRDAQGSLWAVSQRKVVELPYGAKRFLDRTPPGGDPNSVFRRTPIALDPQGRVVVSATQGLARWNGSGWEQISAANGLVTSHITSIRFDSNGDPWLGSNGQGLYHWIGYRDWEGWTIRQGMPSSTVWALGLFRDGQAFLGTKKGPASLDLATGKMENLFQAQEWQYGQVSALALAGDGNDLLAGTFSGALLEIQPKTRAVTQIASLPNISRIVRDSTGRIFIATESGIFFLASQPARAKPVPVAEATAAFAGNPPNAFNACRTPDGSLWFVTKDRIFGIQNGQWQFPAILGFPKSLPSLLDMACAADGSLWVTGQESGTWRLTRKGADWNAVQLHIPAEYAQLEPLAILSDSRGWLWIGTDDGLLAYNGQSWRHLTQESGLVWNDIDSSRLAQGPDGSIWLGTSGGLGHLIYPEHVFAPLQLNVAILQARQGAELLPAVTGFTLPWSNQNLEFRFAAPLTLNRSDLVFSYRIPELNLDWMQTTQTDLLFQALQPGGYTLEIVAANPARGATSPIASAHFQILPPWWRSNWFYAAAAAVALALLWLAYFLRTRHLIRMKSHLELLVHERTAELEASREEMRLQATHDSLTGLLNRGAILAALNVEIQRATRERSPLVVLLADVDFFKRVNDTLGHLAGDAVLKQFAQALRHSIRPYDSAGRYGGEEFLLILTQIPVVEIPERLERLHRAISDRTLNFEDREIKITCSVGAVAFDPSGPVPQTPFSADFALGAADLALYEAKQSGRNRIVLRPLPKPDRTPQPVL